MNSESPAALLPGSFVILHREGDLPGAAVGRVPGRFETETADLPLRSVGSMDRAAAGLWQPFNGGHPVAEPVAAASRGLAFPDAAPHVR